VKINKTEKSHHRTKFQSSKEIEAYNDLLLYYSNGMK
jgi:hypothetical protein